MIQEIVRLSSVYQIDTFTENPVDLDVSVHVTVTGTNKSVENFKTILDYQFNTYCEIKLLKNINRRLFIAILKQNDNSSHFSHEINSLYEGKLQELEKPANFAQAVRDGKRNSID